MRFTCFFRGMVTNNIRTHYSRFIRSHDDWNWTLRRRSKVSLRDLWTLSRSTVNDRLRTRPRATVTFSASTYTQSISGSCFIPFLIQIILYAISFTEYYSYLEGRKIKLEGKRERKNIKEGVKILVRFKTLIQRIKTPSQLVLF